METRKIFANFNEKTVRVYQAYTSRIADEAIRLQTFGSQFKMERMTWIKPSFLWMMYRSGWGTKEGQERTLGIDILREGFIEILSNGILSSYDERVYSSYEIWKERLSKSEVRCQWDPERDIYGKPINRRSIQLGLRGTFVKKYVQNWIVGIEDLTEFVSTFRKCIEEKEVNFDLLPKETEFSVNEDIQSMLGT